MQSMELYPENKKEQELGIDMAKDDYYTLVAKILVFLVYARFL